VPTSITVVLVTSLDNPTRTGNDAHTRSGCSAGQNQVDANTAAAGEQAVTNPGNPTHISSFRPDCDRITNSICKLQVANEACLLYVVRRVVHSFRAAAAASYQQQQSNSIN
jgi:hypothetical protein